MQQVLNGEFLNLLVEGIRHGDSLAEASEPRSWAARPRVPTNNHHRLDRHSTSSEARAGCHRAEESPAADKKYDGTVVQQFRRVVFFQQSGLVNRPGLGVRN